jgi:hypothetical protein
MDIKLTILFFLITTIVTLSRLSEPARGERLAVARWRQRRVRSPLP